MGGGERGGEAGGSKEVRWGGGEDPSSPCCLPQLCSSTGGTSLQDVCSGRRGERRKVTVELRNEALGLPAACWGKVTWWQKGAGAFPPTLLQAPRPCLARAPSRPLSSFRGGEGPCGGRGGRGVALTSPRSRRTAQ